MSDLQCFGYSWITNSQPPPPAVAAPPLPNLPAYNSNMWQPGNVSVVNGQLQLMVQRNSGYAWSPSQGIYPTTGPGQIWAGAQAVLDVASMGRQLTYGSLVATVACQGGWAPFTGPNTAGTAETATTLGIFTFDTAAPAPFNEIDIVEIGYQNQNQAGAWINQQPGGPASSDAQFVLQPWDAITPGQPSWQNLNRIALDAGSIPASGEVTFLTDWSATALSFYAAYGSYDSSNFPRASAPISWSCPARGSIPSPTPTMAVYLNLWPYGGPSLGNPVTFTITAMELPLTSSS